MSVSVGCDVKKMDRCVPKYRVVPAAVLVVAAGVLCGIEPGFAKSKFNRVVSVGDAAPVWRELAGVDGKGHSLGEYKSAKAVVVVFIANRCPTYKLYESRLIEFAKTYGERGVQVVAISVSVDEADGLEKMKERAQAKGYDFPYLHDPSQETGRKYGATVTPHFFLLDGDRKIAYMGAFDDNLDERKVEKMYLVDAVERLLQGKPPLVKESLQQGCEIEYK
jgi:peroxiredoxin